jgi:hypothetical protein
MTWDSGPCLTAAACCLTHRRELTETGGAWFHADGRMCDNGMLPPPPARSLHARPATEADGNEGRGGLVVTCGCGESCLLTFEPRTLDGREIPPGTPGFIPSQEVAYTCDGCQSVHWLTLTAWAGQEN